MHSNLTGKYKYEAFVLIVLNRYRQGWSNLSQNVCNKQTKYRGVHLLSLVIHTSFHC